MTSTSALPALLSCKYFAARSVAAARGYDVGVAINRIAVRIVARPEVRNEAVYDSLRDYRCAFAFHGRPTGPCLANVARSRSETLGGRRSRDKKEGGR